MLAAGGSVRFFDGVSSRLVFLAFDGVSFDGVNFDDIGFDNAVFGIDFRGDGDSISKRPKTIPFFCGVGAIALRMATGDACCGGSYGSIAAGCVWNCFGSWCCNVEEWF